MSNVLIGCALCLLVAASLLSSVPASAATVKVDWVDRSRGVDFGTFAATGSAEELERTFSRMNSIALTAEAKSTIMRIEKPLLVVVYGSMSCPDCTIVLPIIEAMSRYNPYIETLYFERDLEGREVLLTRTGLTRIPTVFTAEPDGTLHDGAYVEHPRIVYDLLESSKTEEEKERHIEDFRAGKYDTETQLELAELLAGAIE